tara:strand:+ start:345 stop:1709 length:1365 start_codon:yes stop_codon:yes gene_type:complete
MSKLLANQISNYSDNGPVEAKDGINVANGKPFQVAGASGTSGQFLKSTGSSVAWQDFPTIPSAQVNADWNATSGVAQISNKPTLATVATSGQYGDLSGLPTIPAAQVNSDWNSSSGASEILNKPTLFSGSYTDLTSKPTIPSNLGDLANVSSTAPNNNEVLKWNGSNWAPATDATGGGGGGSTTFTALTDTPANFTSQAGKYLKVNAGATALEFVTLPVDPDTNTNDYLSSASLSGNTLTLGRTGSQSLADLTVDLSSLGGGGATVTTDDSAPSSPTDGDLWWKSDEGRLKVYYADGSSDQWVDASPPLTQLDLTAFTGHILPATNDQQDIGSASKKIRDLYLGSNSLHLGSLDITESSGKLVLPAIEMTGHMIPDSNAAYDLGNAEYKIRHLFLSDNTMYFQGDFLKVAQHNSGGAAQAPSYLIPLAKLKDALNASGDYEAFKAAIIAIADAS